MKNIGFSCILILLLCVPAFALPVLTLGPATVSGSTISFPVTLAGAQGASITGIEADILFNRITDVFALRTNGGNLISATAGAAATEADKQISQRSPMDGVLHIAIINLGNTTSIPNGVVAQISFDIIAAAPPTNEFFAIVPTATNPAGVPETITGTETLAPATRQLTVTLAGNGSGSVNSAPLGIACTGGSCSANFYIGSNVALMPTAANNSTFGTWAGYCGGVGNCIVPMTNNRSETATFVLNNTVRVGANYYESLISAYSKASNAALMQTMGTTFFENLELNQNIAVTLEGGYDSTFKNRAGYTVVDGTLTVSSGSLVIDRLILQ